MEVIYNEQIVCFDCDDTLVLWPENHPNHFPNASFAQPSPGSIPITDPYDNSVNYLIPHTKHISLLKKYKGRGNYIRVWSAAGVKWAEAVVKALAIEDYVDSVETKPLKLIDDLPVDRIFETRLYLKY